MGESIDSKTLDEMPLETILEMVKDPEAKDEILEVAAERLEEIIEQTPAADTLDNSEVTTISKLPIEKIIDMAKDPNADEVVLEMAVKKIKEVQEQKESSGIEKKQREHWENIANGNP